MKTDLYIDFDSTIVNSDKAVCKIYNDKYSWHKDFIEAKWENHSDWTYSCICPLVHKLEDDPIGKLKEFYASDEFFDSLEFYDDAKRVISLLTEKYKVIICTSAFPMNASKKVLWIEENLPQVDEIIILIDKAKNGYGKSRVAMMEQNSIFIDDHPENLKSTKAQSKYLFKIKQKSYNANWDGKVFSSWKQIGEELL